MLSIWAHSLYLLLLKVPRLERNCLLLEPICSNQQARMARGKRQTPTDQPQGMACWLRDDHSICLFCHFSTFRNDSVEELHTSQFLKNLWIVGSRSTSLFYRPHLLSSFENRPHIALQSSTFLGITESTTIILSFSANNEGTPVSSCVPSMLQMGCTCYGASHPLCIWPIQPPQETKLLILVCTALMSSEETLSFSES